MILPKSPFAKTNHLGIAIDTTAIRAIKADNEGQSLAKAQVNFNQPIIAGEIVATKSITDGLNEIKKQINIDSKYVPVSIPEKFAFTKEYTFPNVKPGEITQAIKWQIEKIFPFPLSDVYYDWKQLEKSKDDVKALITVIPKKLLDSLNQAFEDAELFPVSFEPSASTLSRILPKDEHETIIILELNNFDSSTTVVHKNISTLTATNTFQPNNSAQDILNLLNQSIQGLLHHTNTDTKDISMYISGSKASQGIADVFNNKLSIKTQVLNIQNIEPAFHSAYGAAIASIEAPESTSTINLLPTELQDYYHALTENQIAKSSLKYTIALSIVSIIISLASFISNQFIANSRSQEQMGLQNQLSTPIDSNQLNLALLNQRTQRLIKLFPVKTSPERLVSMTLDVIPNQIRITGFSYSAKDQSMQIIGSAESREDLLNLRSLMEDTELFSSINLPLESFTSVDSSGFNMKMQVDPSKLQP